MVDLKECMRRLRRLFNQILRRLGLIRASRPEDIPKKLDEEALKKALSEARFLFSGHGVEVRSLQPGEVPDIPKPAGECAPEMPPLFEPPPEQ